MSKEYWYNQVNEITQDQATIKSNLTELDQCNSDVEVERIISGVQEDGNATFSADWSDSTYTDLTSSIQAIQGSLKLRSADLNHEKSILAEEVI
jgi:hypothetical protein